MELISAYKYNTNPVKVENITSSSFHNLKNSGWYEDQRGSTAKFKVLTKRIKVKEQWYRVIVRFQTTENINPATGEYLYLLNTPLPFVIVKTETEDGSVFKDTEVFHGPRLKSTLGYLAKGIPSELIDLVISDLTNHLQYTNNY